MWVHDFNVMQIVVLNVIGDVSYREGQIYVREHVGRVIKGVIVCLHVHLIIMKIVHAIRI